MGKRIVSVLLLAALVGTVTFIGVADAQAPDPPAPEQAVITGTITVLADGSPIFGAQVCAISAFPATEVCAFSNAIGVYVIDNVPPGNYTIEATDLAGRFLTNCWGDQACDDNFPAAPNGCPDGFSIDDSLGGLCARFEAADQAPPNCPDGSRGDPGACFIFVAQGPASAAPVGDGEGPPATIAECVPPEAIDFGDICLVVGEQPQRLDGICPDAADVINDGVNCYRLVAPVGDFCPTGSTEVDGECRVAVPLIPGALVCPEVGFGIVDGQCVGVVGLTDPGLRCPAGSFEDLDGNCRRPVANADGAFFCSDPDAALNGTSCVFTAGFEFVCPTGVVVDGTECVATGERLGVAAGQQVAGIDIALDPLFTASFPPPPPAPPSPEGTIRGTVTLQGAPIGGAEVCARDLQGEICVLSAADGSYAIASLATGNYAVSAALPGEVPICYLDNFGCDNPVPVGVFSPGERSGIDINFDAGDLIDPPAPPDLPPVLPPGPFPPDPPPVVPTGSISGTVITDGLPIGDVEVCTAVNGDICTLTAADGTYTLDNLPNGFYAVVASDDRLGAGGVWCYPNDATCSFFFDILVADGPVTGIDIVTTTLTGSINGTVTVNGAPAVASLCLLTDLGAIFDCGDTNDQGEFSFANLPHGEYGLDVFAFDASPNSFCCELVIVDGDVDGVQIDIASEAPTGSISGMVTVNGEPGDGIVCALLEPFIGVIVACVAADPDGTYTIGDLDPGEYFVDVGFPGFDLVCYLECTAPVVVQDGPVSGVDINAGEPAIISPPTPPAPALGGIAGVVSVEPASPFPIEICASGPVVECSFLGADGSYLLSELPAGDYVVEASTFDAVAGWCYDGPEQASAGCLSVTAVVVSDTVVGDINLSVSTLGVIVGVLPEPVSGQQVCISGIDVPIFDCVESDALGRFILQQLPGGLYQVFDAATGASTVAEVASPFVTDVGELRPVEEIR